MKNFPLFLRVLVLTTFLFTASFVLLNVSYIGYPAGLRRIITSLPALRTHAFEENSPPLLHSTIALPEKIGHCRPKTNLLFLKTHKTGSSSIQNVLVRFAWDHGLVIGLPNYDILFQYQTGKKFRKNWVAPVKGNRTINMLVHHMIFDYENVSSVIPKDSVYFTVLRDPATQFESAFDYMRPNVKSFQRVPSNNSFERWMSNPEKYFKGPADGQFWWAAKNGMSFDLGLNNLDESESYIEESISKIDSTFNLVMIAEYFDMSLMLLKELLCWSMDDLLSLPTNARDRSTVKKLNPEIQEKVYNWNKIDTALYRYYNATFWRRVEQYGVERMERDLAEYEKRKNNVKKFCVEDKMYLNQEIKESQYKVYNPKGVKMFQYKLRDNAKRNSTCIGLILPEIAWFKKIRSRQYVYKRPTVVRKVARLPSKVAKKT